MDTSSEVSGKNITPKIINNYDGKNIELNENIILDINEYPDLLNHKNKTLITTDGTTLLGADDKAGIAEIMQMVEYYCNNDIKHGDIYICFTPDEEIGRGTKYFDIDSFKVDYAYTVDGIDLGEFSYDNFNAATVDIEISGVSTHSGYAKDKMINSMFIGMAINEALPNEIPSNTENYEGFYHLQSFDGRVGKTTIRYLIRDFDKENFENRKRLFSELIEKLNIKYNNCIKLNIKDSFYNMKNVIGDNSKLITNVKNAMKAVGTDIIITLVRGGTDGARLTYNGLPCPNLGACGRNFHSIYEYVAVEDMEQMVNVLIQIVKECSKEKEKTYIKK